MYLVCGEALIDCFLDADNAGGSMRFDARVGGSPFNVALGIARLGGTSSLLTGISADMFGAGTRTGKGDDPIFGSHPAPDYTGYGRPR
jgi:fructokinase